MSQAQKYEAQLHQQAVKHFESLPEDAKPATASAHSQLLSWLINMDRATKDTGLLVTDVMAQHGVDALNDVDDVTKTALAGLDGEARLKLVKYLLSVVFRKAGLGATLLSRGTDLKMWEATGFHMDGVPAVVNAKIGANPYQPIGFDDGTHYIATPGSKRLWSRDWRIALMLPFVPAFEVAKVAAKEGEGAISEGELQAMRTVVAWFEEDDLRYHAAKTDEEKADELERIFDDIDLARLRLPRLDMKLKEIQKANPELGAKLQRADATQLLKACTEFCRMHIDDAAVAKDMASKQLVVGDGVAQRKELISNMLVSVNDMASGNVGLEEATNLLRAYAHAVPELKPLLATLEGQDIKTTALAIQSHLKEKLDVFDKPDVGAVQP